MLWSNPLGKVLLAADPLEGRDYTLDAFMAKMMPAFGEVETRAGLVG